ncbi:hypothetical protein O6H91_21G060600 [Diphasiastrum complanatum]|uniref:Uncharacterized protein n=1 Tax=Diphasiastrum complanatum TaxID=34168 RepID=A0ACC2AL34_DIPCM|nr:hypothetical protein O6H91_21G060600 [Diphasiastrum complanatum]
MVTSIDSLTAPEQLGNGSESEVAEEDGDQMEELHAVFDTFDENRDGQISIEELRRSMARLGLNVTEEELVAMMAAVDKNGNGFLEFEEFLSLYKTIYANGKHRFSAEKDQDLRDAFSVFDRDGDGFITAQELQFVFNSLGFSEGVKLSDCHNMIRGVDKDGDDRVNFPEFKVMMNSKNFAMRNGKY